MKFQVEVDDGTPGLVALHKAREAWNKAHGAAVPDLPTFVQCLVDQAVGNALQQVTPADLPAALSRIADLESQVAALQEAKAASAVSAQAEKA